MSSPAPEATREGHTIARNVVFAFAAQLAGAAFTAFLTIFLARKLGTHGYGILSLALGIAGLALLPSDFGISSSVTRFVAEHRGDRARAEGVVADGFRVKVLIAAVVSVLMIALAKPIAAGYGLPALVWPIRGVALALFAESLMMFGGVFAAIGRLDMQLRTAITESAIETTATVALVLAGAGATGAAFGKAIGYVAGTVATIVLLARAIGPGVIPRSFKLGPDARRIAGYASVLLVINGAYTAFLQVDVLIIGAYLGASSVGIFSAPLRLIVFFGYPGLAISNAVGPRLVRSSSEGPNVTAFVTALRVLLVVQALITAFVLGWAGLLSEVALGSGYKESTNVLRVLAPYVFLGGVGVLVSVGATYLGEAVRRVPVAIATALLNLVVDLILVPRIGVVGGAIGTDAAFTLYALAHLFICQRSLQLDLRPTARTFARAMLAGAAMTGVLLLFGDSISRFWALVVGALLGLLAFALVLLATREVSVTEARELLDRLPLVGGRGRGGGDGRGGRGGGGQPSERAAAAMQHADGLTGFYDDAYTQEPADAALYSSWRALGALGKADHVIALCERAGIAPRSTLEVGCGDGALLCELHARGFGGRLAGVEITDAAVAIARERPQIDTVERYDGEHLPYAGGAFELGILSHVLEHVPDPAALLAEVARVCGAVVVEVPLEANVSARRGGKREHAAEVGHLQRLDVAAVHAIAERAGVAIIEQIEDPLPLAVHSFFATGARARTQATAKWAVRSGLHGAAPALARRLFTVHYACLCVPASAVAD